ncbi:unnamed protein product [Phytophthora fragariaefolia]|uniref:Unnamed protein product n=1 Tax=Phytophthora fragariaefolia TaxID=1490495 RepID=A0A9W7CL32_9STRA|nr:unnamed protein product [Phytophthora fragariaefolia]
MESLGPTELAVLYNFFDDNDVIGDFILTPRETPLTAAELSSQLKNFAVKCEFTNILSQFDSKQLALRTFGTVSLLREVVAKYSRIKRMLAEDEVAASVVELQDEVLRLKCDQSFQSNNWIERVVEVRTERNAAVAQMRSDFVLLVEEREKDISSLRSQVQILKTELGTAQASRRAPTSRSQGPRLRTAHVMNVLQDDATVMMNWPRLRDLRDHLKSGTQVPSEWQSVISVMANDNLAFQAPPFVRMDPPQDGDDEEAKESDPPRGSRPISGPVPGCVHNHVRVQVVPVWQVAVRLSISQDEAEDKAEKEEVYNPHQEPDDGVDDEDEDQGEASDDGVLNIAQRTTKRRRLSQSSTEAPAPKKLKAKSPVKTKVKYASYNWPNSGSGSQKKPKSKSGGSRRRNSTTATALAAKRPQHLDAGERRVIETPGPGITLWM